MVNTNFYTRIHRTHDLFTKTLRFELLHYVRDKTRLNITYLFKIA